jgi:hypothetical protein
MRTTLSNASLRGALALGALLVFAAGCDSGGDDPADDLGDNTSFAFAAPGDTVTAYGALEGYDVEVTLDDPGYQEGLRVTAAFDEGAGSLPFEALIGAPRDTTFTFPQSATAGASRTFSFSVERGVTGVGDQVVYTLQDAGGGSVGEGTFTLRFGALSVAEARQQPLGSRVATEGVFTRIEGANARIQSPGGATGASGIVARADTIAAAAEAGAIEPGDRLRVTGGLGAFNGLLQIGDDVSVELIEEGAGLPEVQSVASLAALQGASGEEYESELVRVEGLSVPDSVSGPFSAGGGDGFGNYPVTDGDGSEAILRITDDSFYDGEPIPDESFAFSGVIGQFSGSDDPSVNEGYQLLPLREGDLLYSGE